MHADPTAMPRPVPAGGVDQLRWIADTAHRAGRARGPGTALANSPCSWASWWRSCWATASAAAEPRCASSNSAPRTWSASSSSAPRWPPPRSGPGSPGAARRGRAQPVGHGGAGPSRGRRAAAAPGAHHPGHAGGRRRWPGLAGRDAPAARRARPNVRPTSPRPGATARTRRPARAGRPGARYGDPGAARHPWRSRRPYPPASTCPHTGSSRKPSPTPSSTPAPARRPPYPSTTRSSTSTSRSAMTARADPVATPAERGNGLRGIAERVSLLGGDPDRRARPAARVPGPGPAATPRHDQVGGVR